MQARILALLVVSVFINYIDRGNLSIAAPMLKDELHLSASQLGILLSSFFWTYAAFQLISGWLVDRFAVRWVMAAGFFLWSMATAATGLMHGFLLLLIVRLVLGIGESVAYPSYSKILTKYFPEEKRGLANSLIVAGNTCGPGFGMFLGGMLMARYGWRSFFVVLLDAPHPET
jgi:ACS family D-galactonate transporter-like MFS transporter